MRRTLCSLIAVLVLCALPIIALANFPVQFYPAATGAAAYVGPGDVSGIGFTQFWSVRAMTLAIAQASTQKFFTVQRTSDNRTCDFKSAGDGSGTYGNSSGCSSAGDNGTALATWCNATTCFFTTWYDQTGGNACTGSCDATIGGTSTQTKVIFSCLGSIICIEDTVNGGSFHPPGANKVTPATGKVSLMAVGGRTSGTGEVLYLIQNGLDNRIKSVTLANNFHVQGGTSGSFELTAADGVIHALAGIIRESPNGASSFGVVDQTVTTGTTTGDTVSLQPILHETNGASTTLRDAEIGMQDNVAWTQSATQALQANQKSYFGTP